MRQITMTCRCVADAEKRLSKSGKEYLYLRVANNEYTDEKDANGNQKTFWFTVFGNEHQLGMQKFLTKGKPIIISGDYKERPYTRNDGTIDPGREINANYIGFIESGNSDGQNGGGQQRASTPMPSTQTSMTAAPVSKPSTADIKIPQAANENDDVDDLPF